MISQRLINHINGAMMKVLMVCMGNICRSPTAEAVLRKKADEQGIDLHIDSAGTLILHAGNNPDPRSIDAGISRGYDFSGITSRPIADYDFEYFDIIALMDDDNWEEVMMRCPPNYRHKVHYLLNFAFKDNENHEVPDPYYSHDKGFDEVLNLVEQGCDGLLDWVKQRG